MRFRLPSINQFSFWLGFILSGLLWWVISVVRSAIRQMTENSRAKQKDSKDKTKSISAVEERYRQVILQYVQGLHLAAPLFALDEIIQTPLLMAPPLRIEPGAPIQSEDIVAATLPYLPSWPELAAFYKAPTLTIPEALSVDSDIVITGNAGMGKTVALADLASRLARRDLTSGLSKDTLPFFIHAVDLDMPVDKDNPLNSLIDFIAEKSHVFDIPRIPEFVRKAFSEERALLLLDGIDELTPDEFKNAVDFLRHIKRAYPKTRIVTTSSNEYLDGLISINIVPFAIAAWDQKYQEEFLAQWTDLWTKYVSMESWAQNEEKIDPIILSNWISTESAILTPLELTLKIWGTFAGDIRGSRPMDALETHLRRLVPESIPYEALEQLAVQTVLSQMSFFDPRKAGEWVKSFEPSEPEVPIEQETNQGKEKKSKQEKIQPPSHGLITNLVNSGLLSHHRNNRTRFVHPVFGGFLAGKGLSKLKTDNITDQPPWIGKFLALEYLAATGDAQTLVDKLLKEIDRPLARNLFTTARWLRDCPQHINWRGQVMAKLLELIQQDGQPLGLRGQAVAALIQQREDPSVAALFRKMLEVNSTEQQLLAAIACGALRDTKSVDALSGLAADPNTNLRRAACLALSALGTQSSMDAVAEVLLHGDENQGRTAAEALANNHTDGYAILREGAQIKELMVRRASAYGLGRIAEDWAMQLLAKLQTDDAQWIVRNAANEAIEERQRPNIYIPKRLPPPTESPWIIAFAGKQGLGVTPDKPPTDLLLAALQSDSLDERIASLYYLRTLPVEDVLGALYKAMYGGNQELREAVYYTISELAARGLNIPDPQQYGIGNLP